MTMSTASSYTDTIPVGETETYYPASKRRIRRDHTGRIIYDSNKDKEKKDK
jgi:hypothetical protein